MPRIDPPVAVEFLVDGEWKLGVATFRQFVDGAWWYDVTWYAPGNHVRLFSDTTTPLSCSRPVSPWSP